MLTEDEAKAKRCCGPRGCGNEVYHEDTSRVGNIERLCIGSACMAWRWGEPATITKSFQKSTGNPLEAGRVYLSMDIEKRDEPNIDRHGFCGFAGRPS